MRALLLFVLASCKGPAQTPAPLTPDARPVADEACKKQVADLAVWMGKLAAAGRVELDFGAILAEVDLPARWVAQTDDAELRAGFCGAWDATVGIRSYMEDNLADRKAMEARLAATLRMKEGPEDDGDGLRVDIDHDASWSSVVEFAGAAATAGYRKLHLTFKAKSPLPKPAPSAIHDAVVKSSFDASGEVWKGCKDVPSFYYRRVPGKRSDRDLAEEEARAIPAAIQACACAVDFPSVYELVWSMNVGNGTHRTFVTLPLAAPDAAGATMLERPAAARWSEAVPAVLAAAGAGKPVSLRASGAASRP